MKYRVLLSLFPAMFFIATAYGQEAGISGKSSIDTTLSESANSLADSIIIPGSKSNATEKKRNRNRTFNKPVPDENRYSRYNNIYDLIRTELPEIQITGNTLLIRGYTSVTGSSQPIFVVDGVIMTQIDDIMPNRVRSIRVLKGSSAAIYGMNGANGVLEINTISNANAK